MRAKKSGAARRRSKKRILKAAKGFVGGRRRLFKSAKETLLRAGMFAYRDRRSRKRDFRRLWITRISAAAEMRGLRYSRFIQGVRLAGIGLDRKSLSELAIHDPETFDAITDRVRAELEKTGAVAPPSDDAEVIFNKQVNADAFERRDIDDALVDAVEKLDRGETGMSLWLLYRYRDHVAEQVMQRLNSPDADVSWYAAGVAAMWAEPAAEPRLIRAIEQREYGFDEASDADERQGVGVGDPTSNRRLAPNWLVAVCLLRRCGANACVPALAKLAEDPALTMNARAAIALTLQRLADDKRIDPASNADDVLDQLLATPAPADHGIPQRFVGALAHHADDADDEQIKTWLGEPAEYSRYYAALNATEDHAWQLHLAVARARLAMGLPMHEQAAAYLQHPRSLVRHAFERIAAKQLQTVTV